MSARWQRWLRTFHTIKHLQPRQAWYFFLRRGIGANTVKVSANEFKQQPVSLLPALQLKHTDSEYGNFSFTFLNRSLNFPRDAMDWCPHEAQRLWRYNLHYFDFLREEKRSLREKIALIDDWIERNPQGSEPAWEPYTASLRIVNWCLFFWSLPKEKIRQDWLNSLHLQAFWLERNLELHILANHYFENIKAMIFASFFFDDRNSIKWRVHFQNELITQLAEQTLADGGHYERSPQYHCILLEDYLDLYALLSENTALANPATISALAQTIEPALTFLAAIVTPDDDIPLFNDSASGVASRPSAIFAKARELGFSIEVPQTTLIELPESGLFGWKCNNDYFLIDCGDIGPNYQPGHTHCDFLSYVLMLDGQWVVVDSGLCEYEPGAMRTYVRSTAAHNTLMIDQCEQSEIWGEFRVGRRAKRIDAALRKENTRITFTGSYRGFPAAKASIVHLRNVILDMSEAGKILTLTLTDKITGEDHETHLIESFIHLHPTLSCAPNNEQLEALEIANGKRKLLIKGLTSTSSKKSWYCPQFGVIQENQLLQQAVSTQLPATLSYQLQRID
ncbi:MAG: alginate lyase family protein [Spongiibacteraceae bacterium]